MTMREFLEFVGDHKAVSGAMVFLSLSAIVVASFPDENQSKAELNRALTEIKRLKSELEKYESANICQKLTPALRVAEPKFRRSKRAPDTSKPERTPEQKRFIENLDQLQFLQRWFRHCPTDLQTVKAQRMALEAISPLIEQANGSSVIAEKTTLIGGTLCSAIKPNVEGGSLDRMGAVCVTRDGEALYGESIDEVAKGSSILSLELVKPFESDGLEILTTTNDYDPYR